MGRLVAPDVDVTRAALAFDDGAAYESRSVSASAVRANVGTRWGLLTGLLDAVKVVAPILVARAFGLGEEVQLAIALAGLVGHVAPVYHRFRGGLGESVTYGTLLVFDPLGVVASIAAAVVTGFATGNVVVLRESGMLLFAGWAFAVRDDPLLAGFAFAATVVYHLAAIPESRRKRDATRGRPTPTNEQVSREFGMGSGLGRAIDRYGLPALVRRLVGRTP